MSVDAAGNDVVERFLEVAGQKGRIRVITHPSGKAFMVDIQCKNEPLNPVFIELALYDVAALIAHQHALVETMLNIKGDSWT